MKMYSIVPEYQESVQGNEEDLRELHHPADKDALRASVSADVEAYLQSGKEIHKVPSFFEGRRLKPAHVPFTNGSGWAHTWPRFSKT